MEDEEYKKLPVEDRCVHKLWKARVNGYEEVTKLFRQIDDEKSPEFGKYLGLVKKFVIDSNVMGQEKGLEATLVYVENYAHAGKTVSEVMSGIVSKCIAAPKTKTRELALQVTLMYVEIEKGEAVLEELIKGMDQKNPKIVSACINASTTSLREFGAKVITVKPLVKKISVLFADRDKTVRDEARLMVIEIYRWIGAALRPQLNNLQPLQITELESEFSKIDGQKASPLRYIRSQQQKQKIREAESAEKDDVDGSDAEECDEEAPPIDPYELADPVDILSKLPKDFDEKIEAKKWQERKEVLETLENLLNTPKLQNGDYADVVRALKKVIEKDSNVVVVALAGKCLGSLATSLKKRFQIYATACVSSLLEKFKEKKQNVLLAIRGAIDAIYLTTTLEAILEDVLESLGNKNPSVKSETSLFLARCFTKTSPTVFNKKMLKTLTTALMKNINEPDPGVRDSSAEGLGTLMKLVGEKAVSPFLVELEKDNLKMAKIRECCEKAVITVKASATKERPVTAPPTKAPIQRGKESSAPKSAPAKAKAPAGAKKKVQAAPVANKKIKKSASKTSVQPNERALSDEEAEELVLNVVSATILADLADGNWKTRLAAVENFQKEVRTLPVKEVPTQALLKAIVKKPGLKDINFQVLKAKLDVVKFLAENCTFSTTSSSCCMNDIIEKFGDAKNGALVAECMTAIAEATSLGPVSTAVIEQSFNQKNPKVMQESLNWLSNVIKDFGFANLNAKLLIDNAKKALASTNPGVRQAAITFCGVLYLYMGDSLYMFFENEKPALREQISLEFTKYEGMKPPTPTKGVVKSGSVNSLDDLDDDESVDTAVESAVPNLADLMPRVDISGQMTEALLTEIEDKVWKVRSEALTKIITIIQEAKFIKSNLGELPAALARRLTDSNVKVAQTALNICEAIAKAMGAPCKQHVKVFLPGILQLLGDNKSWVRTTARETIDAFSEQCGYREFFENEMIADALKTGSPTLRIEVWGWLAEKLPLIPLKMIPKEELLICIPYLYSNLEDRNSDVRKNAQEATLGIMIHVGYEAMFKSAEKLKPVSQNAIIQVLEKVRPLLPEKPQVKKAPEKEQKVVRGTKPVATAKNAVVKPKRAAAPARPTTTKKKEEDLDTSPLLMVNNTKHQRTIDEAKLKVLKWNFTTPREEFVELLKDQMTTANVNKTLISNMFHVDFRFHIKALETLMDDLACNGEALIANLDLILKWLTLRFFDTNPSVLLKGLEYLHCVFNMLTETKYIMLETEASAFLPYLVVKIGDPKDSVRNGVRSLFKQICNIYPINRLFNYIMEGVKSKNARQRAECLEAMCTIISEYGINACANNPGTCLKEIAKQISDRDNSVRNAALNCVVAAYNIIGEKVYRMIGNISDKDLSLLEERIKRSKKTIPKPLKIDACSAPVQKEIEPTPMMRIGTGDTHPEIDRNEEEEEDLPPVIIPPKVQATIEPKGPFSLNQQLLEHLDHAVPKNSKLTIKEFDLDFLNDDVNIPSLSDADSRARIIPLSPPKPLDPNLSMARINSDSQNNQTFKSQESKFMSCVTQIASHNANSALQAIERMSEMLLDTSLDKVLMEHEDDFMRAIISQLRYLSNKDPKVDQDTITVYRKTLMVVDTFYHNKKLGRELSIDVLKEVISEFINILAFGKLESCTSGEAYVRVINVQCVNVIEKSNHTRIICALLELIHEYVRMDISTRHTDLVMKCLWKVIKVMPNWEDDLNYDMILQEVHNFLKEFPSVWWKNKSTDTTLRTIKTILHSVVKLRGGQIMIHLRKIPNASESEIEAYTVKLLKSINVAESSRKSSSKPDPQRRSFSRDHHQMLTEIFQKIGKKEETKDGLTLLYDFMQQHPDGDIEPFLKKSSQFFQDYIQNGLRDIEERRKAAKDNADKKMETADSDEDKGTEYWSQKLSMLKNKSAGTNVNDN